MSDHVDHTTHAQLAPGGFSGAPLCKPETESEVTPSIVVTGEGRTATIATEFHGTDVTPLQTNPNRPTPSRKSKSSKIFEKFFEKPYPLAMRSALLIPFVALSLSACDPYSAEREWQAQVSSPCLIAVRDTVKAAAGPDVRGIHLVSRTAYELGPDHYAVHVKYREKTVSNPSGGVVKRLDCELRAGKVLSVAPPPPL